MLYFALYLLAALGGLTIIACAKDVSYTQAEIAEDYEQQYRDLNRKA